MSLDISVIIITLNEEKNIERCLKSLSSWASEIIVVDSASQDKTLEICKRYTHKIYVKEFLNYADQKNHALSLATKRWIFSVDADEEVTETLQQEIAQIISSTVSLNGYSVLRKSFIFQHPFRYTGTQCDRPLRLFKREKAHFVQPIHEIVQVQGKRGALSGILNHYTYPSISDYMVRFNRYTTMESDYLKTLKYHFKFSDLLLRPIWRFVDLYLLKQGFRDGVPGFIFSVLSSFYVFIKYNKYWESTNLRVHA